MTPDRNLQEKGTWNWKRIGGLVAMVASLGLLIVPQPGIGAKVARLAPELDTLLADRTVQIDGAELLDLMHNNQVRLLLLDVRDEADFNVFHLLDAWNVTAEDLLGDKPDEVDPETIVVLMSNDEARAAELWRLARARGLVNSYILAGGINGWLEHYGEHFEPRPIAVADANGAAEPMRFTYPAAIGDRTETAWPDPHHLPPQDYEVKVKVVKPIGLEGGGCG